MSDVLVILSSETWGSLLDMVHKNGGHLRGVPVWGDGHRDETLQQFLNHHLSEMTYNEKVHIITSVVSVKTTERCPYPRRKGNPHESCGWIPCAVCGRGEWAHPDIPGLEEHEYVKD